MCCILRFGFIFSLDLPKGKLSLWCQGSMSWNTKVSDEGVGKTSSECMKLSESGLLPLSTTTPSQRSVEMSAFVTVIPRLPEERMGRGYLCLTCLWTCLTPTLLGPLMKIWRSQGKVSPNRKGLLPGLLLWYTPSHWWNRVPCLGNLHDARWMRQSLDAPFLTTQKSCPTTTSPSNLYLCHVFGRVYLIMY